MAAWILILSQQLLSVHYLYITYARDAHVTDQLHYQWRSGPCRAESATKSRVSSSMIYNRRITDSALVLHCCKVLVKIN